MEDLRAYLPCLEIKYVKLLSIFIFMKRYFQPAVHCFQSPQGVDILIENDSHEPVVSYAIRFRNSIPDGIEFLLEAQRCSYWPQNAIWIYPTLVICGLFEAGQHCIHYPEVWNEYQNSSSAFRYNFSWVTKNYVAEFTCLTNESHTESRQKKSSEIFLADFLFVGFSRHQVRR